MPKRTDFGRCRMCGKKLKQRGTYCSLHSRSISEVRIRFKKKGITDETLILKEATRLSNERSERIKNKIYPNRRSGRLPESIRHTTKNDRLGVKGVGLLLSNIDVPI